MKSVRCVDATVASPPTPQALRTALLTRRISTSGPLAIVISDLAFGSSPRDDIAMTAYATAARIAAATGAHS